MPLAALAVHELRYLFAFGGQAGQELNAQGHAYLTSLTPSIVLLCALAFGGFIARLAQAWQHADASENPDHPMLRLWFVAAVGLLLIYVGQETLEGFFATGHPAGLAGVFGDGGWWSGPAAIIVGGLLTLLFRGADAAVQLVAGLARRHRVKPLPRAPRRRRRPQVVLLIPLAPLACSHAGRAPPFGGLTI